MCNTSRPGGARRTATAHFVIGSLAIVWQVSVLVLAIGSGWMWYSAAYQHLPFNSQTLPEYFNSSSTPYPSTTDTWASNTSTDDSTPDYDSTERPVTGGVWIDLGNGSTFFRPAIHFTRQTPNNSTRPHPQRPTDPAPWFGANTTQNSSEHHHGGHRTSPSPWSWWSTTDSSVSNGTTPSWWSFWGTNSTVIPPTPVVEWPGWEWVANLTVTPTPVVEWPDWSWGSTNGTWGNRTRVHRHTNQTTGSDNATKGGNSTAYGMAATSIGLFAGMWYFFVGFAAARFAKLSSPDAPPSAVFLQLQALSHFKIISAIGVFVSLAFLLFSTALTVMMSYWWDRYLWYLPQYGFETIPAQPAILMPMILHAMHGVLALIELIICMRGVCATFPTPTEGSKTASSTKSAPFQLNVHQHRYATKNPFEEEEKSDLPPPYSSGNPFFNANDSDI